MRIIEADQKEEVLQEPIPKEIEKNLDKPRSIQEDLFDIAEELHTIGSKLSKLAAKL